MLHSKPQFREDKWRKQSCLMISFAANCKDISESIIKLNVTWFRKNDFNKCHEYQFWVKNFGTTNLLFTIKTNLKSRRFSSKNNMNFMKSRRLVFQVNCPAGVV